MKEGQGMQGQTSRRPRTSEPVAFAEDTRPGAAAYVYCKGCGQPLESRDRFSRSRVVVTVMMCDACREKHGHELMPMPGAPTFCYRCGDPEDVFVTSGLPPVTYHVCSRCLPDRAARYRAGDFDTP
jgi:hypothetical protein